MTVYYHRPEGVYPEIVCVRCGCRDFVRHENAPGRVTFLECVACRADVAVNLVAYVSAGQKREEK